MNQLPECTKGTPLVCPCGKPLEICKRSDGVWILGHLLMMCSPLISGKDANEVLSTYINAVESGTFKAPPMREVPAGYHARPIVHGTS